MSLQVSRAVDIPSGLQTALRIVSVRVKVLLKKSVSEAIRKCSSPQCRSLVERVKLLPEMIFPTTYS